MKDKERNTICGIILLIILCGLGFMVYHNYNSNEGYENCIYDTIDNNGFPVNYGNTLISNPEYGDISSMGSNIVPPGNQVPCYKPFGSTEMCTQGLNSDPTPYGNFDVNQGTILNTYPYNRSAVVHPSVKAALNEHIQKNNLNKQCN
tara:strand:- start:230 stop:670 length:441 start_codon:yes stop_codon:yes gene_type:complete